AHSPDFHLSDNHYILYPEPGAGVMDAGSAGLSASLANKPINFHYNPNGADSASRRRTYLI
ncbi:MAG: hypothetical protein K2G75_04005, partial [Muribaculaceae bacterium]|nr:hypothetical protein [Muribaculaceae bacterium]